MPVTLPISALVVAGLALAPPVMLRVGEHRSVSAPASVPDPVAWFVLAPLPRDYNNPRHCGKPASGTCHDPLRYQRERLSALNGQRDIHIEEVPRLAAPGTRLLLPAPSTLTEVEVGEEALEGAIPIVVREGDEYTGLLTELLGVPFVYWPDVVPGVGHQTDARLGADCVATVIYGRRRLGYTTPYWAPGELLRIMQRVPKGADGTERVAEGDVLHFGFQTAVLVRDEPPRGRLNDTDLVIHAYHGLVERVPYGSLPYRIYAHSVLRWPECTEHRCSQSR